MKRKRRINYTEGLFIRAVFGALRKLSPFVMVKNPVMFVVEVGSAVTTIAFFLALVFKNYSLTGEGDTNMWFSGGIALCLWFTVIFANFSEALAEGRGKAQAESLRATRQDTVAFRFVDSAQTKGSASEAEIEEISASELMPGDVVLVQAGQVIPADGTVIEGAAAVDESAITGESAPVIRESGGDRSAVTGGTTVLSDILIVRITQEPGKSFLDRMIALVEGAERQKTPNEIALGTLLVGLTIIFSMAVITLKPFAAYHGANLSIVVLAALLVCLIPTTIGGLLSAIGIAGMDRLLTRNVLALSGRAVEAAGDVDVLLLDKTGTITIGNRMASEFIPLAGVNDDDLISSAYNASMGDETPEGRSILALAEKIMGKREPLKGEFVPFTAETRMSGINLHSEDNKGEELRKGSADAVFKWAKKLSLAYNEAEVEDIVKKVASSGGTPLLVVSNRRGILGVIHLKDIIKPGMKDRFERIRAMGIKTIMVTGDNTLTAKAIAEEAGVDDFLAEATPEDKLRLIKELQQEGRLVAMSGDGTNDAPALAQSDVGLAMNTGTQAAREAGNMVDLDSDPTKLIEIVEIGKQLLITRGALTTFSVANDIAKYFAILPAIFVSAIPQMQVLNIMGLRSPQSAILSAVIFNALIIVALIPLAMKGARYRPSSIHAALRRNLLVYGVGGVVAPFVGIKLIDMLSGLFV